MALIAQSGFVNTMLAELTQAAPVTSAAGVLNGCKVGLFVGSPTMSQNMLLADLTAPSSPGLALSSAVTWGTIYNSTTGEPAISSDLKEFIASGTIVPESVSGFYLVAPSGSPTVPFAVEMFDVAVPILHDGDGFSLAVQFSPSSASIGHGVVID